MSKHRLLTPLRWTALAAAASLSACSLTPDYTRPDLPVSTAWPAGASTAATTGAAAELPWQSFVQDAHLREVIALALLNNRDLKVAVLNIEQARAQYQIRRADQFPNIGLAATGLRQPTPDGSGATSSFYTAGLSMTSWELDFFGRLGSLKEAALAQYMATDEARKAAQISLVASVASVWLSLQANSDLLTLTQDQLRTREETLRLVGLRHRYGAASDLDLRLAESQTAATRAAVSQQQRLRALDQNSLTLLVGAALPDRLLARAGDAGTATAGLLSEVPVGLPAEVLTRRPDVVQAEWLLKSANANIGAARAAYLPRITLTASAGAASNDLANLLKNGAGAFSLAPQAFLPIFDGGRIDAGFDSAQAGKSIAVAQYEKALQVAFREVSDALVSQSSLAEQLSAQQAQVNAETERSKLTELRYLNGIGSSLDTLDAQRSLLTAQQALSQLRLAHWQSQVTLYKALGGGWSEGAAQAPSNQK